jgi:hypothetical protein
LLQLGVVLLNGIFVCSQLRLAASENSMLLLLNPLIDEPPWPSETCFLR